MGRRSLKRFKDGLAVARNIPQGRLQDLVEEGILQKSRYQEKPDRYEYFLTGKGSDLYPAMVTLMRWGDRWMADPAGPSVVLMHKSCEHASSPVLTCSHCAKPIVLEDVYVQASPGLTN